VIRVVSLDVSTQPVAAQTLSTALAALDENADGVSMYFTSHLLATNPGLVERWPVGIGSARRAGYFALREVVAAVEDGQDIEDSLADWGEGLARLGLTADELTAMVASVEATLRRFLGDAFVTAHSGRLGTVHQHMMLPLTRAFTEAAGRTVTCGAEVVGIDRRGADVAVLTLRPERPVDHRPGQSVTVRTPHRPRVWRPFSPANQPRDDGTLELHVRAVAGGLVSPALVYETEPGDVLELGAPVGTLGWSDTARNAVLLAGGTGIAPFLAMLDARAQARGRRARQRVHVVRCGTSDADVYDLPRLRELESAHGWLTVETLSGPEAPGAASTAEPGGSTTDGDPGWVADEWADRDLYVCGSPRFVSDVVTSLDAAGIDPSAVHLEQYGSPSPAPSGATAHGGGTA
jgi:NAD(P)H-flavin reductase